MNEHVAIPSPELNLARELPFNLAGTLVRPAALEIEYEGEVIALEPRVMKVLVALHRSRGEPVSRDDLIDLCWGGRIVTEGALNRCVAQLRRTMGVNPRLRFDTIATVGYRLQTVLGEAVAEEAAAPEPELEPPPVVAKPARKGLILGAGLAVLTLLAVGAVVLALPRPVTWTATAYRPLTSERGLETHPALSPAGDQIVYAQRPDGLSRRDLYLRSAADGTPVRITTDPEDDYGAVWSPKGDRIAFVRTPAEGPCSLVVVPVPLGPERTVARCQSTGSSRISWLNENTLLMGDRAGPTDLYKIRAVDVATGAVRDVTEPPASTLGDGDPMASPDGRYFVFRRSVMHGAEDLVLMDMRTGKERSLTTDGWKAAGYVWSADSRHIFFSSNSGGEFGLWTVDTRIDAPPRQISLGLGQVSFSRMSSDRNNRLAVEVPRGRTSLAALSPDGAITPITTAAGLDWDPEGAADGTVAYVSSRGGSSEVWVTHPDGRSVRLTSIVGSYVHGPTWSPNGQTIAFIAIKSKRAELYTVARDGSRLRTLTDDGAEKLDPVYGASGDRIFYIERTAAGYRLMQVALTPGAQPQAVPGGAGWTKLRGGPDGRLYGQRNGGDLVQNVGAGAPAPEVRIIGYDAWSVGRDGIYVLRGRRETPAALWLHPWAGPPRKLADIPAAAGSLGVAPDGTALVSQDIGAEIDLGLIELAPGA